MNNLLAQILEITDKILNEIRSGNYDIDKFLDEREKLIKDFVEKSYVLDEKDKDIFQQIEQKSKAVEEKIKSELKKISDSLSYNSKGIKALKNGYLKHFESSRFKFEKKG
jgi:flagellar hook-associated protein FlgK